MSIPIITASILMLPGIEKSTRANDLLIRRLDVGDISSERTDIDTKISYKPIHVLSNIVISTLFKEKHKRGFESIYQYLNTSDDLSTHGSNFWDVDVIYTEKHDKQEVLSTKRIHNTENVSIGYHDLNNENLIIDYIERRIYRLS